MQDSKMFNRIKSALNPQANRIIPSTGQWREESLNWSPARKSKDLVQLFKDSAVNVDAHCVVVPLEENECRDAVKQIADRIHIQTGIVFLDELLQLHDNKQFWTEIFGQFNEFELYDTDSPGKKGDPGLRHKLALVDLAVTGCRFLLADTGTAGILTTSMSGREGSLLPPHHLIVAKTSQIYSSFSEVVELEDIAAQSPDHGALVLVSGPSRTADIEKTLVKGVHGPVSLSYLLYDDC